MGIADRRGRVLTAAPAQTRASRTPRPPRLPNGRPLTYAPPGYRARLLATLHRLADPSERGWQVVVAGRLGVSKNIVSMWETGDRMPSLTVLVRISAESGVSLHWMLTGHGPIAAPDAGAVP